MKILIVSDAWHPQINGVVRTYEHLRDKLIEKGHEVKVIGPRDFPWRIPTPGYPEIKLAILPYNRLKKMIEDYAADRIHISTEGPLGAASRKYCIKNNIPFSTSYHTQFPDYVAKRFSRFLPFLYKPVHKIAVNTMRNFHAPSKVMMVATQSLEDTLREWGFKTPIHRLSRGVNLDLFHPGEDTVYKDLPKPVAVYVGRVAIEKSIEDFLSMDWEGSKVVVGHGPSEEELKHQYPDAVFVGSKTGEELAAHYRSADVFVFPSRTDTFGMVLIEALASGLPVAAYNVTGPKDIITEDYLGVLGEDLSKAAHKSLKHGTAKQRFEHIKNNYTWENVAKQYIDAIENNQF